MILVDTSVLIDLFKGKNNKAAEKFNSIIVDTIPFGITPFTFLELLQGSKNEKEFKLLEEYLVTQNFYYLKDNVKSYLEAAKIRLKCSKKGIMINSTIDFLIVQTAIEHNLYLLHNDNDFERIGKVINLKIYK